MEIIVYPNTIVSILKSNLIPFGSTLFLHEGNYLIGDLKCELSGITITSFPNETVTIKPMSGYRVLFFSGCHDIILSNLVIDAEHMDSEGIKITDGAYNIMIKNCEIKNAKQQGILVTQSETYNITISKCNIHHNGLTGYDHGIYFSDASGFIFDNEVYNNSGHGIHIYGNNDIAIITIKKNNCHNNGEVGIGVYYGIVKLLDNICKDNQYGIRVRYNIISALVAHNISVNGVIDVAQLLKLSADVEFINNISIDGRYGFRVDGSLYKNVLFSNNLSNNNIRNYIIDDIVHSIMINNVEDNFVPINNIIPLLSNPDIDF